MREVDSRSVVGILTVEERFLLSNYGSFFQHWALRRTLADLGYRTFLCARDYRYGRIGAWCSCFWCMLLRPVLVSLKRCPLQTVSIACRGIWDMWQLWNSSKKFLPDFESEFGLVGKECEVGRFIGVIGSDQPWNSNKHSVYLEGDGRVIARIAYAVSGNWAFWQNVQTWRKRIRRELLGFTAVSVREKCGVNTFRSIVPELQVARCLDPVLLVNRDAFAGLVAKGQVVQCRTLLCYIVSTVEDPERFAVRMRSLANALDCQLCVIGIQGADMRQFAGCVVNPAPFDFIRYIRDAEFVVTNSFHGLAFSVLFAKRFGFYPQSAMDNCTDPNVRQHELLGMMGLSLREFSADMPTDAVRALLLRELDAEAIGRVLDGERAKSIAWLSSALRDAEKLAL